MMRAGAGIFLIVAGLLGPGCANKQVLTPPPDPVTLADEIDPGPLEPLLRDMPDWARDQLGVDVFGNSTPQAIADLAATIFDGWTEAPSFSIEQIQPVVDLLRRIVILELHEQNGAPCDVRCLSVRAAIYNALDIPWFADRENFFGEMLTVLGPALGDEPGMQRQAAAIIAFVQRVFTEAPRHHRRIAARLLRTAPASPEATDVLAHLAAHASREEKFERARDLYLLVVGRTGAQTTFTRWADLAGACYRSFSLPCGDEALAAARKLAGKNPGKEKREQLQGCERTRKVARLVMASGEPEDLPGRLRLGSRLIDLGHLKRARNLFQQLRQDHPRDARPFAGLAKVALADNLHSRRAADLLRAARNLENKDLDFYQVAVGMAFGDMVAEVLKPALDDPDRLPDLMAPFLERVRQDIRGLARFDRKRAGILGLLVDTGSRALVLARGKDNVKWQQAFAPVVIDALARVDALRTAYPDEPDVLRLQFLLARLVRDRGRALHLLRVRLPDDLASQVAVLRGTVLRALAVVWQDGGLLDEIPDELPGDENDDHLRTEVTALRARLLDKPRLWQGVERGVLDLLEDAKAEDRARLYNNLGVALFEQGRVEEAVDAWSASVREGADYLTPELNLLVAQPGEDTVARLDRLAESKSVAGFQAKAWSLHLAGTPAGEIRKTLDASRKLLDEENTLCAMGTGGAGVVLADTFQIGFGYSSLDRLVINLSLQPRAWLLLPAPPTRNRVSSL